MSESALAKKMKLRSNLKAAVINAPENYVDELKHDTALSPTLRGKFDWIQIFVRDKAELAALAPKAAKALRPESMLWISFPQREFQNSDRPDARPRLGESAKTGPEMAHAHFCQRDLVRLRPQTV